MEQDLFNQVKPDLRKAIIIGASSGIGKELATILVTKGYKVGITGRREELLKAMKESYPDLICYQSFDITDLSKTTRSLQMLIKELGGLDLLVVSAGVGFINEDLDISPQLETIATNVTAFTDIMSYGFTWFRKKKAGHLVGITSIAALRGNKRAPSYNASKAYQVNYLEGLRHKAGELKLPITVTDVRPGFVRTHMAKGDNLFWVASPEKAAWQIYKAILKKKRVVYVTRRWWIFAFLVRLAPGWFLEKF
jgi:short-subunit dehydrogenase